MIRNHPVIRPATPARFAIALFVGLCVAGSSVREAHSAEIIPFVGFTRAVDSNDPAAVSGGVALRSRFLTPFLQDEISISYRSESRFDDQLKVRMWPITASLWLTPIPALYAGAGVGFYNVTLDYDEDTLGQIFQDETNQDFGIHLGGGLRVPLTPKAALDLNGRYVMIRDQNDHLVPDNFDPDFWSANLGLAIRF